MEVTYRGHKDWADLEQTRAQAALPVFPLYHLLIFQTTKDSILCYF